MRILYEAGSIRIGEVTDDDGEAQRQLLLGPPFENLQGAIKTGRRKFHVQEFTRNLTYGALCVPGTVRSALFLGLGAGVVIQTVRDLFPAAAVDIVDLNAELFAISNEYFYRIDAENIRWFSQDASEFVAKADRKYDYICCDIWGHHLEPPRFLVEEAFAASIKGIMNVDGALSVNTQWFLHKQLVHALAREFEFVQSLKAYNCILVATNQTPRATTDEKEASTLLFNNIDVNSIRANAVLMRGVGKDGFLEEESAKP